MSFIDIHHQSMFKSCAKKSLKGKFQSMSLDYKNYKKFSEAKKDIRTDSISKIESGKDDCFFFGSDEIWNISKEKITRYKEFFCIPIPGEKQNIGCSFYLTERQLNSLRIMAT